MNRELTNWQLRAKAEMAAADATEKPGMPAANDGSSALIATWLVASAVAFALMYILGRAFAWLCVRI